MNQAEQFDLLAVKPMDSPRLAWLKKHNVTTKNWSKATTVDEDEFGNEIWPWTAFQGSEFELFTLLGTGLTEHDAIASLAIKRGWKLWNEETLWIEV